MWVRGWVVSDYTHGVSEWMSPIHISSSIDIYISRNPLMRGARADTRVAKRHKLMHADDPKLPITWSRSPDHVIMSERRYVAV